MNSSFRQVCDKPCANGIIQTEWSPHHDLIAVVTGNGDIRLHRMHWQKVWVISPKESPAVCCSWKCDGKLLAVGHGNGDVSIIEIEKAVYVHTLKHASTVTSLSWEQAPNMSSGGESPNEKLHEDFLPQIRKEELLSDLMKGDTMSSEFGQQCYLTVGTSDGSVHLYLDGILQVLEIPLSKYPIQFREHCITSTHLCTDTGTLTILSKSQSELNGGHSCYVHRFQASHLCELSKELYLLSQAYTKLHFLIQRCRKVLKQMSDSSEDISLKINSKLEKLEELVDATESSVSAEFTIAYATGDTSAELDTFLTQNLTSKGLKQIEQSVQLAYASMHSDITEEVELLVQHIMVYLLQVYGMSKWTEKYRYLGLSEKLVLECFRKLGVFAMRILKLLEVICSDMEDFGIFFTWLTSLCFQVSGEAQANFPELSFKDYDVMLDFLENRLLKSSRGAYNLERISQFFIDDGSAATTTDSPPTVNDDTNHHHRTPSWFEFVKNNEFLKDCPFLIVPDNTKTLQTQFEGFLNTFDTLFEQTKYVLSESVTRRMSVNLFAIADGHEADCAPVVSFLKTNENKLLLSLLACSCDSDRVFLMDINSSDGLEIQLAGLLIEPVCEPDISTVEADTSQYTVRCACFYNRDLITLLYDRSLPEEVDQSVSVLAQLPIDETLDKLTFLKLPCLTVDGGGLLDQEELDVAWLNVLDLFSEQRALDNFKAGGVSVNAKRSVSCVLSTNTRRVRVFDMDSNEDEDPDETRMSEDESLNESEIQQN